jgi:dipeptidyl aminopeptidase/acylaminoacyl peptidase
MPTLPKLKLIPAALALVALLALPAAANATLSYGKTVGQPKVYYAQDNGRGVHLIGPGLNSKVSPNGEFVAYERSTTNGEEMRLFSLAARKSTKLLGPWQESFIFAWSPDSSMVAALTGPLNGPFTLLAIDVKSGKRTRLAKGFFNGVSFSPDGEEIAYGVAKSQRNPFKSDVFKIKVDGTGRVALSHNHSSGYPLWGPKGQIAFARFVGTKQRKYGPKSQIFVMNEEGQRISQLTHTKVNQFSLGLTPLGFSENGARLLTEFTGQDQGYAVAVSTVTGNEKKLTQNPETGFQGAALSADGSTALGTAGMGFGNSQPKVVTVPWSGGKQKVLVKGGYQPSWGG